MVKEKLDLTQEMANDLIDWAGTEVIVVADDSGSMRQIADRTRGTTRWDELKQKLNDLLELLLVVDGDAHFELRFLNTNGPPGSPQRHSDIHRKADLDACWAWAAPGGATPLINILKEYMDPSQKHFETDRLVIVMTDGEPSDGTFESLRDVVVRKPDKCYASFIMCTEDDDVVNQYERSIDSIKGVDVHDDYWSEKSQAEKHGRKMNLNTYLVKCILGPKLRKYDELDEDKGCTCVLS
jgi:hypothetical protein